jgi:hypothetical protein
MLPQTFGPRAYTRFLKQPSGSTIALAATQQFIHFAEEQIQQFL